MGQQQQENRCPDPDAAFIVGASGVKFWRTRTFPARIPDHYFTIQRITAGFGVTAYNKNLSLHNPPSGVIQDVPDVPTELSLTRNQRSCQRNYSPNYRTS